MTANHQAHLEAPYHRQDAAAAAWERRSDELATARPKLVEHLADIIDSELRSRIEWPDILGLRVKLGEWLDGLRDGELEDRVAVELGILGEWAKP